MATHDRQTVQLFYNKTSGRHCSKRLAVLRSRFEANGARVILSECGPGADMAIGEDVSHICAVGGDGTIRHVALALCRSGRSLPMSIYPGGTINLVHRELASPTDPDLHALRVLSGDGASHLYSVEINDSLFLACASVGPDSRAVASLSPGLKRRIGRLAYAVAFFRLLANWPRQPIRLRSPDREVLCEAFYVAKGRFFAGPWSFAPAAQLGEPLLHVIALERATRRDYLRFLWSVFRGRRLEDLPRIAAFTCTSLSADADQPLPVQADGDIVTTLPVRLNLRADPIALC
jgi:diacylglycerol kinase family enzyme